MVILEVLQEELIRLIIIQIIHPYVGHLHTMFGDKYLYLIMVGVIEKETYAAYWTVLREGYPEI